MEINRRAALAGVLASASSLGACTSSGNADGPYPSRDITFIIPVGAGGGTDIYARLIGEGMEKHTPHPTNIIPMNIASGGGGKGITQLFRAPPDGYTVGIMTIPGIFTLQKVRRMPYDLSRFSWLGAVTQGENFGLAVGARSPLRSIGDLQDLARKREITFAASGPEGTAYSATQVSAQMLGLQYRMITGYRGSNDYITGAMRGDSDAVIAALSSIRRLQDGGALRVLASFELESTFPNVPGARELGQPDLAMITAERVIAGPPGMTDELRATLSHAIVQAASDPNVANWANRIGERLNPRDGEAATALVEEMRAFFDRWDIA